MKLLNIAKMPKKAVFAEVSACGTYQMKKKWKKQNPLLVFLWEIPVFDGRATLWVFNWRLSEARSRIYKYQNKNLQKSQKVAEIF